MVDLGTPLYDDVLKIDQRLQQLYSEVGKTESELEEAPRQAPPAPATQKFLKSTYRDLPSLKADERLVATKPLKPQVSKKWKQTMKATEPRIEQFYERGFYEPEYSSFAEMKVPFRKAGVPDRQSFRNQKLDAWMRDEAD